jgi:hypothetical protein
VIGGANLFLAGRALIGQPRQRVALTAAPSAEPAVTAASSSSLLMIYEPAKE